MSASWPSAPGEMAERIRVFDWSRTSLGPIESWSPALRTAVGFMVEARQAVFLGWGADTVSLYNDSIVPILGAKHPSALGKPYRELFAEVWEEYRPILERTMAGEAHYLEDQPIRLAGRSEHELGYFTYSWTPLREADGTVAGFLSVATETTEKVRGLDALRRGAERQAFLLELADALRPVADPVAVQEIAARTLGLQLRVDRCYYAEFDWPNDILHIYHEYVGSASFSVVGSHPISLFQDLLQFSHKGEPLVCDDIATHPVFRSEIDAYRERGTDGFILVPMIKRGIMVACMCVTMATPRSWAPSEIELVREVAERTWATLERIRAETALRESEQRFRALVMAGTYSIYRMSPDWRVMRQLDSRTLANTAGPIEDWVEKYIPDQERPAVFAATQEAIRTKSVFELEHRARLAAGGIGWVLSRAVPLLGPDGEIVEWFGAFSDVTERRRATEQLREREADLARVQRIGKVGGLDIDVANGLRSRRSPEYLRLHGLPPASSEETHAQWRERVYPDDRDGAESALFAALDGDGASYEGGYRIVRPSDGAVRWIHARADIERDRDGRPVRLVGAHLDVTEQKRVQEALRISEERLRGFGEASTDVLWIRDAETLAWTYLTPAFETIYGLPREAALGGDDFRTWLDLIVPEDRDEARRTIHRVRDGESVTFEYRVRRPLDGVVRWLRNTDFPIRNAEGSVVAIGGVGHDVTREKEADRLIQASRRELRTLVEGVPQLVWRGVAGGEWTWSSPQWTAFTGLSSEASIGRGWLAALHPDDREHALDAWARAERAEEPLEVEYRLRRPDGESYRWFQTRAAPLRDEDTGAILEWLGTSTDIDDIRRLQEEQTVMVAELQHRTRNLIGVVGMIMRQMVASSASLDDFRARFSERLEALSRVQSLFARKDDEAIGIGDIVRLELDALGMGGAGGRVRIEGDPVPLRKSAVQTLSLAIHELATNARKYGALRGGDGRLAVRWRAYVAEAGRRWLRLEWTETGIEPREAAAEAPLHRGGYGRKLIEEALPYTLKARTTYALGPDRLDCTVDMPLDR